MWTATLIAVGCAEPKAPREHRSERTACVSEERNAATPGSAVRAISPGGG